MAIRIAGHNSRSSIGGASDINVSELTCRVSEIHWVIAYIDVEIELVLISDRVNLQEPGLQGRDAD